MTWTKAKVEFLHIDTPEEEGKHVHEGALEIVEEDEERILVQISSGDYAARAYITTEDLEEIWAELAGMEWIGTSGGENFYGPKAK